MSWMDNYISGISQTNNDFYREYAQEWINGFFDDSTLVQNIKEQKYPFCDEYEDYEVQIDTVAEITVNIIKVIGDYIDVIFKDCTHTNHRGQKYIYNNEYYLCYDRTNEIAKVAQTKLLRCNNKISWLTDNGQILTEPVFLGYEITSTNDQFSKTGNLSNRRMIIYCQNNENTKKFKVNQRFMFNHDQCFRIEELDNYNTEVGTNGEVTMLRMVMAFSSLLNDRDNTELNICDYYNHKYVLNINQDHTLEQPKDFVGQLDYTITLNDNEVDNVEVEWYSSDNDIVSIDNLGNYTILGDIGESAIITCKIKNNDTVYDSIEILIKDIDIPEKVIIITPIINELKQGLSQDFICQVYSNGVLQSDKVLCNANFTSDNYILNETTTGYKLTNVKQTTKPLILTFSCQGALDVIMNIKLRGVL